MSARGGPPPAPLPIDALLAEIVGTLQRTNRLVLQAPPGAGKTTRVPPALLEAGLAGNGEVWVLEPRRLATRLAAARVAEERGEPVGETIGYTVRLEERSSTRTRLRFVTEGILGRRLVADPALRGIGAVVLDEFHERHLAGDVALALLRRLQESRPELRLLVMSATLDPGRIAGYLDGCPVLTSEGRAFPVEIEHLPAADARPLDVQVLAALKRLQPTLADGHVLVFLPGAREIRRAHETCADFASRQGFTVLPLHGDLPSAEQDRAVRPAPGRKLVLSTNVAETSVTVDGVAAVVDSGVARIASHSPWSGLPRLQTLPVSKASAAQRAGRAGRTRAGRCLRLYTRHDLSGRPEHEVPEIARVDLAETVLALSAAGAGDLRTFPFLDTPPLPALESAERLLGELGALGPAREVTDLGRRLLRFPVHPRLARIVVEGERRGVAEDAARIAALLGERDILREGRAHFGSGPPRAAAPVSARSDVLERLELLGLASARGPAGLGLDAPSVEAVRATVRQLNRALDRTRPPPMNGRAREDALLISLLAGYPDRVARRRRARGDDVVLAAGGSAVLDPQSTVRDSDFLVAVDAEQHSGPRGPETRVRLASGIEEGWLLDLFPAQIREEDARLWNPELERVDRTTGLFYGALALEEARVPAPADAASSALLAEALRTGGLQRVLDPEALETWLGRLALAAEAFPEAELTVPDEPELRRMLADGRRSFDEIRQGHPLVQLAASLSADQQRLLTTSFPEQVTLPGGRRIPVRYPRGQAPWIASRLQDFFGMRSAPTIAQGRVTLVLHLLAPNQRPVQVTTDLSGFWSRHYPALRRELGRRYPRHAWPEDPLAVKPGATRR